MASRFTSVRGRSGAVSVKFDATEIALLRGLFAELLDLVTEAPAAGDGDERSASDELADMVGIGTATTLPTDPALARLFPNGYRDDDEAAADFRRYTEPGLRDLKQAHARTAIASLDVKPGKVVLDAEQALAWLGALNDIRLAIGERVSVSGITLDGDWEHQIDSLAPEDPRRYYLALYDLLTWLQETLVHAIS